MEPLTSGDLRGTWAPVLLPVGEDEAIDFSRLAEEISYLVRSGLSGIYTNGTSGEFMSQSHDEYLEISRLVAEECTAKGVPFQLGASHTSPQICIERIRSTRSFEPSAYQVILPDWVPPTFKESVDYLEGVAQAAEGVNLVLYLPQHSKTSFDASDIGRLAEAVPAIIGVKIMDGNNSWYGAMRRYTAGLALFVPGSHIVSGLLEGAQGAYSNVACLSPRGAVMWEEIAHADPLAALAVQGRVIDFLQGSTKVLSAEGYCGTALDKFLAAVGGWCNVGTKVRWPYQSVPEHMVDQFRILAREQLPEFFVES